MAGLREPDRDGKVGFSCGLTESDRDGMGVGPGYKKASGLEALQLITGGAGWRWRFSAFQLFRFNNIYKNSSRNACNNCQPDTI